MAKIHSEKGKQIKQVSVESQLCQAGHWTFLTFPSPEKR